MGKARADDHDHPPDAAKPLPPPRIPRQRAAAESANGATYRKVLAVGEFRAVWLGHAVSTISSNLLLLSVAMLVYQRTGMPAAAGFTVALTLLPPIFAGPLLSIIADLCPRRRVMVISDLVRAALIAAIGLPGMPIWGIWLLVALATLPGVPHNAARAALLAEILPGNRYVTGSSLAHMTSQVSVMFGLLLGGVVVSAIGPGPAMLYNGLGFVAAAFIVLVGVRSRRAPRPSGPRHQGLWAITAEGAVLVFSDPRLRTLALLSWLAGFYVIPSGLAAPLADEMDAGASGMSLLMAAVPAGALIGSIVWTRLVPPAPRARLLAVLAAFASLPLVGIAFDLPLELVALLLLVSGVFGAYQFVANATFVLCAPASGRGRTFGVASAGLQSSQGLGILAGSVLAGSIGAHSTIAVAGAGGAICALALIPTWRKVAPSTIEPLQESEQRT
ncbi:MFS transporter [Spiractinospora alimapuensis]|uniref:MFS transporter n=1 Tax=Spiractinospora alimapuensis TaxID=2820884 RepID=UPI001F1B4116|nr:MFS transporter [Spiractinospora alimapuensis]QVQ54453.1 MFS transporter [Spiractinospora alimapuensis]